MEHMMNRRIYFIIAILIPLYGYTQECKDNEKIFVKTVFFLDTLNTLVEQHNENLVLIKNGDTLYYDFLFQNLETDSCNQNSSTGIWKLVIGGSDPIFFLLIKYGNICKLIRPKIEDILPYLFGYITHLKYSQEQSLSLLKAIIGYLDSC